MRSRALRRLSLSAGLVAVVAASSGAVAFAELSPAPVATRDVAVATDSWIASPRDGVPADADPANPPIVSLDPVRGYLEGPTRTVEMPDDANPPVVPIDPVRGYHDTDRALSTPAPAATPVDDADPPIVSLDPVRGYLEGPTRTVEMPDDANPPVVPIDPVRGYREGTRTVEPAPAQAPSTRQFHASPR